MTLCFQCCSAAVKLEKSGGLSSLCVLLFLLKYLTVKEIEIQTTKMENLDNSKEAGAGIKSAIFLRSFLPFFRYEGKDSPSVAKALQEMLLM